MKRGSKSMVAAALLLLVLLWPGTANSEEQRELNIVANYMRQYREEQRFELKGDVFISDEKYQLWGDEASINKKEEYIEVIGSVELTIREQEQEQLTAGRVVLFYNRDSFEAFEEAHYTAEQFESRSDYLANDGELLTLTGDVVLKENGNLLKGDKFLFWLEDEILEAPEGIEIDAQL